MDLLLVHGPILGRVLWIWRDWSLEVIMSIMIIIRIMVDTISVLLPYRHWVKTILRLISPCSITEIVSLQQSLQNVKLNFKFKITQLNGYWTTSSWILIFSEDQLVEYIVFYNGRSSKNSIPYWISFLINRSCQGSDIFVKFLMLGFPNSINFSKADPYRWK